MSLAKSLRGRVGVKDFFEWGVVAFKKNFEGGILKATHILPPREEVGTSCTPLKDFEKLKME